MVNTDLLVSHIMSAFPFKAISGELSDIFTLPPSRLFGKSSFVKAIKTGRIEDFRRAFSKGVLAEDIRIEHWIKIAQAFLLDYNRSDGTFEIGHSPGTIGLAPSYVAMKDSAWKESYRIRLQSLFVCLNSEQANACRTYMEWFIENALQDRDRWDLKPEEKIEAFNIFEEECCKG